MAEPGLPAMTDEEVIRLRRQYDRLREQGFRVETFYKVQARNKGLCKHTIVKACKRNSYKHLEDGGDGT